MPEPKSEYNQKSFVGGMNLLLEDTHLDTNQYRLAFNTRNRLDRLDLILSSKEDVTAPRGVKQEMVTFGEYEILFVQGKAYYKHYTAGSWTQIQGFQMDQTAPRFWTKSVPIAETNYLKIAASYPSGSANPMANAFGQISVNNVSGAAKGNLPGLLVQDNINQPVFIFLDANGFPTSRVTQNYAQWSITFTDANNTVVAADGDKREYVPIGNVMEFVDGVLYITSQDGALIYQSVSGRPLDFVRNIPFALVADAPYKMTGGGDASTTAYSVGVGPISCLRAMSDGSLFVAAGNSNFAVSKDKSNNATRVFGEFPLVRKFLFNATCLSDRTIIDTLGDTRFIALTGIRSFNAISQTNNEGRNLPFSAMIQPAFIKNKKSIPQDAKFSAAILYDDYELYAVETVYGPAIAVYDTLNKCWVCFDVQQTNGKRIKMFAKIELSIQSLYAVTEDEKVYNLYVGPGTDNASFRTVGVCSSIQYAGENIKMPNPKNEVKLEKTRVILNAVSSSGSCSFTPYVNNRIGDVKSTKTITYSPPDVPTTGLYASDDVDTNLKNLLYSTPNCKHGWKVFGIVEWNTGSITQFSMELNSLTPQNPLNSQS